MYEEIKAHGQGAGQNTLSFLQATSVQDANVLISSLCLYQGHNQTKLFFYSFPSVEPNVLIFIVL